jgi:hypothetical protein
LHLAAFDHRSATGKTVGRGPVVEGGKVQLMAGEQDAQFALLVGDAADQPDVVLTELDLTVDGKPISADEMLPAGSEVTVSTAVKNVGLASAKRVAVTIQLDGADGPVLMQKSLRRLKPDMQMVFRASLPVGRADGKRRILVTVTGDGLTQTGPVEMASSFLSPTDPARFPIRVPLSVVVPTGDAVGIAVELPFTLPADADPANLRIMFPGDIATVAQFEAAAPDSREGTLVFTIPAEVKAGTANVQLLAAPVGDKRVFPPVAPFTVAEDGSRLVFGTYSAKLFQGTLSDISVRQPGGSELPVVSSIIESSKETGWSDESGEVTDFALEHSGPVRAVFRMSKTLKGDFKLTRRFLFYADRCEIVSNCTPHRGLLTRTMYCADGSAVHELSKKVVAMDGVGNAEDFGFKGDPQWFAAYGPKYRSACFALTPAAGFTYWDSGSFRGQMGLGAPAESETRVYVWGPGAENADYAKKIWQAYSQLLKGTK